MKKELFFCPQCDEITLEDFRSVLQMNLDLMESVLVSEGTPNKTGKLVQWLGVLVDAINATDKHNHD